MVEHSLRLRPFRRNDAKSIVTWIHEPEAFYKWTAGIMGEFPLTVERLLEVTSGRDDNDRYFPFTAFDEDGPVGFFTARIRPEDDDHILRLGYVIVSPEKRGLGYGKKMLELALTFAFEVYGAKKVSLGVFENNIPAYHCYRSVGFKENGLTEKYNIFGHCWVDIEMEILHM